MITRQRIYEIIEDVKKGDIIFDNICMKPNPLIVKALTKGYPVKPIVMKHEGKHNRVIAGFDTFCTILGMFKEDFTINLETGDIGKDYNINLTTVYDTFKLIEFLDKGILSKDEENKVKRINSILQDYSVPIFEIFKELTSEEEKEIRAVME